MVNDPQTVIERVTFVFILGCIFMGAYMTVTQNVEFLENRDASIISYHPFNQEPSDHEHAAPPTPEIAHIFEVKQQ